MANILIVDDDIGIRDLLTEILQDEGHTVYAAANARQAREAKQQLLDLIFLDIWMPDTDGITLLKEWVSTGQLSSPVIMMSGHGTIETAIEATRIGAQGFLEKPIGMQKLLDTVKKNLQPQKNKSVRAQALTLNTFPHIAPLAELRKHLIAAVERRRIILLRTSESGLVELAARCAHAPDTRWIDLLHYSKPLTLELMRSPNKGILFCEELADLHFMQQKNVAFASQHITKGKWHLIVGSRHSAHKLIESGWPATLLKSLFEITLPVPALSQMQSDIPELATQLLYHLADESDIPLRQLSIEAQNALRQYAWPGGFSEFISLLKTLAVTCLTDQIKLEDVHAHLEYAAPVQAQAINQSVMELPLRKAREIFERQYFEYHIARKITMTSLAELVGVDRTHLYRKLRDLGLRSGKDH